MNGLLPADQQLAGAQQRTTDPKCIVFVRLSALGDVIHGLPAVCSLRRNFPQTRIVWVVEQRAAGILQGHPAIDELIVLERGWLKSPCKVWHLHRRLGALGCNVSIDAQGLTKSAMVSWLTSAPRRIGMGGRWGREVSPWLNNELVGADNLHPIPRALRLLEPLGVLSSSVEYRLPIGDGHRGRIDELIGTLPLTGGFVLMASCAGWESKLWPGDRFAAVAAHLGKRWNLSSLLIWGNDKERERVEQIAAASEGFANVAPKLSLLELAALANRARFVIGCDTGPLHLAAAAETPCIGLYGPWPAELHGPYGPQHINVQKMILNGTTKERRHASSKYMEAIDVADICQACDTMVARTMPA